MRSFSSCTLPLVTAPGTSWPFWLAPVCRATPESDAAIVLARPLSTSERNQTMYASRYPYRHCSESRCASASRRTLSPPPGLLPSAHMRRAVVLLQLAACAHSHAGADPMLRIYLARHGQ